MTAHGCKVIFLYISLVLNNQHITRRSSRPLTRRLSSHVRCKRMKRECPSCKGKSISVFRLMFMRSKCNMCGSRVGHHWIYSAVFWCAMAVALGFLSIYLQTINLALSVMAVVWFSILLILIFASAAWGPLEKKMSVWES